LGRQDQERLLGRLTGLPADAAAMAITEGRLEYAVELLEQGRAVLLTRQLEASAQHAALREHAPELAGRLAWVQRALDLPGTGDPVGGDQLAGRPAKANAAGGRAELARQRDVLIQQIRARPDLENLVTAPSFSRLAAAAARGPVIILNISAYRCDALIVASGTVQLVPLSELSASSVTEQTEALLAVADNAAQGMTPVLEWIWGPNRLTRVLAARHYRCSGARPAGTAHLVVPHRPRRIPAIARGGTLPRRWPEPGHHP